MPGVAGGFVRPRNPTESRKGNAVNNQWISKVAVWLVIALVLFTVFKQFDKPRTNEQVTYTQFMEDAKQGRIKRVEVQGRNLKVTPADGQVFTISSPGDLWMVGDLMKFGVQVSGKPDEEPSLLQTLLLSWGPMLLLIGVWIYFMRQMQGGGKGGAFSFGKSKARMLDEANNSTTFADVAGCDEAKEDAAGQGHRRRSQGAFLLDLRLRLRGNVRGCRRCPRARHVRAGQEERALHHLRR
jgi:cell division protease FtsH